jgi:hypothetical protein
LCGKVPETCFHCVEDFPKHGSIVWKNPLFHTMETCFPHRGKPQSGRARLRPSRGGASRPRRAVPPLAPSRRPAALGTWMGGGRRAHAKSAKSAKELGGMRKVKRGLFRVCPLFFPLSWAIWRRERKCHPPHARGATRPSKDQKGKGGRGSVRAAKVNISRFQRNSMGGESSLQVASPLALPLFRGTGLLSLDNGG